MLRASTIFALASAVGKAGGVYIVLLLLGGGFFFVSHVLMVSLAGVAVVRVSGPNAKQALVQLAPPMAVRSLSRPRSMTRVSLVKPGSRELIDDALAVWFPGTILLSS